KLTPLEADSRARVLPANAAGGPIRRLPRRFCFKASPSPTPRGSMIGQANSHFRLLGQIGEGGMGVVYVAEDTRLGRRVAIKIPHAGKDERHYRARFLKEARAVSKLSHRNIAAVYDLGETDDGQPYIVMELVSGQTLGDL